MTHASNTKTFLQPTRVLVWLIIVLLASSIDTKSKIYTYIHDKKKVVVIRNKSEKM